MAVYDLDSMNEEYEETDNTLDNMLEACEYMIDMLDESARTKYVEMKGKQAKEYLDQAKSIPDKETKTVEKNFKLPFGYSVKGSKTETIDNTKRKHDLEQKGYGADATAAKYAGTYKDYGPNGIKNSDGSITTAKWSGGDASLRNIHNAGKPKNRYDDGAHDRSWKNHSTKVDYEAMAKSKAGKDAFNKDFGGPQGRDYIGSRMGSYHRTMYGKRAITSDDMKDEDAKRIHQNYIKGDIKSHLREINKKKEAQKKSVKEACLYILSRLDDMDE